MKICQWSTIQKNETSLHLACHKGCLAAAKELVAGGASLDVANDVCFSNSITSLSYIVACHVSTTNLCIGWVYPTRMCRAQSSCHNSWMVGLY